MKIGFIDYYLDEWHANNYPDMIKNLGGGKFEVCCAYGMVDSPKGLTNEEWAKKYNIPLVSTIEEVIEQSDYIVVLSPNNPEMHEELCKLPLESGKRVYIDKTFAPDVASAKRIFEYAEKHNTPCYSCSALHFADEFQDIKKEELLSLQISFSDFKTHFIHQVEPAVKLMGSEVKRLMYTGHEQFPVIIVEFSGGRYAYLSVKGGKYMSKTCYKDDTAKIFEVTSPFFERFVSGMLEFFETGEIPVPHEQTLAVIAILEACRKAETEPFTWIDITF